MVVWKEYTRDSYNFGVTIFSRLQRITLPRGRERRVLARQNGLSTSQYGAREKVSRSSWTAPLYRLEQYNSRGCGLDGLDAGFDFVHVDATICVPSDSCFGM
jgi:hypothetical protein